MHFSRLIRKEDVKNRNRNLWIAIMPFDIAKGVGTWIFSLCEWEEIEIDKIDWTMSIGNKETQWISWFYLLFSVLFMDITASVMKIHSTYLLNFYRNHLLSCFLDPWILWEPLVCSSCLFPKNLQFIHFSEWW